jgi:hypothetical protein
MTAAAPVASPAPPQVLLAHPRARGSIMSACSVSFRQAYCCAMDAYFLLLFYIQHFMEHLEKYSLVDSPTKRNGFMRSGLGVGKSRGHVPAIDHSRSGLKKILRAARRPAHLRELVHARIDRNIDR